MIFISHKNATSDRIKIISKMNRLIDLGKPHAMLYVPG